VLETAWLFLFCCVFKENINIFDSFILFARLSSLIVTWPRTEEYGQLKRYIHNPGLLEISYIDGGERTHTACTLHENTYL
jgi:hypothetical protein